MFSNLSLLQLLVVTALVNKSLQNNATYDVVVIGGGVSGLATCFQLIQNGVNNILLLEASDRLGGRINTIQYENGLFELGAQWIHGNKNNPVFDLMKSLNEIDSSTIFYNDEKVYSALQDGSSQAETKVDYIDDQIQNVFDTYEEKIPKETPANESLGKLLDKKWSDMLKTKLKTYDPRLCNAVYKAKLDDMRADYACNDFYELSAYGFADYDGFGGEENNNLKNGYIKLIQYLSTNLPKKSLKLNEKVSNIDWSSDLVKIKTSKNNYDAKRVVTTVSLGVLKAQHKQMFTPALPADKTSAIKRLGFGVVNKIFFIFDKPVFSGKQAGLQFLWDSNTKFVLDSDKNCNLNGSQFYKSFNTLTVIPNKKNVLFGFFVGEDSVFSETISDQCMIDVISEMLTKFFPKLNIPRPRSIVRSKWSNDPLVRGSYSFTKVGSTIDDTKTLAKSVNKRLFFAGEATTSHIGTVHGAYMTGLSTANTLKSLN